MTMKKAVAHHTEPDKIDPERYRSMVESYTYEDYTKDFELDYLGWDGTPDAPASDASPDKPAGDDGKPAAG